VATEVAALLKAMPREIGTPLLFPAPIPERGPQLSRTCSRCERACRHIDGGPWSQHIWRPARVSAGISHRVPVGFANSGGLVFVDESAEQIVWA
jgi:hypothetical protein